jgi:hypothetical protein
MTSISTSTRGFGSALDLGVAALAAASIGFLAFAMPDDLFSSMVSASHLPDLVAAAAPPLGMKARYAVIGAGAGLSFLLVWSLMRALDGGSAASSATGPVRRDAEPDAPRLRRADAHPDAPARRPLIAREDLGEPALDQDAFIAPGPDYGVADRAFPGEAVPEAALEPIESRLPRFMAVHEVPPAPERDPIVPPSQKKSVDPLSARAAEIQEAPDSIGSLMQRLERGLVDREDPIAQPLAQSIVQAAVEPDLPPPLVQASSNPEASLSPEGVRHRLRSAINDLNQSASRG